MSKDVIYSPTRPFAALNDKVGMDMAFIIFDRSTGIIGVVAVIVVWNEEQTELYSDNMDRRTPNVVAVDF